MKKSMLSVLLAICALVTQAQTSVQNDDKIYSFLNELYTPLSFRPDIFKSNWGIFLLNKPYLIDNNICDKIKPAKQPPITTMDSALAFPIGPGEGFTVTPKEIVAEFYNKCIAIDRAWQHNFRWQQERLSRYLLVKNTKNKLLPSVIHKLKLTVKEKQQAAKCIEEWNKAIPDDRLINYCSIPIFSDDGDYVFIVIGQDVASEGGWDSIYIFKNKDSRWVVLDEIRLATI